MALIGQGAQGVPIDYSAWSNSAWNLANANAGAIAQVGAKIEGMIEQRKKNKDTVKVSADKIDAAIKLFGDQGGYLTGIRESLKDEDVPLSQRAALGGQIDEMLNLGIDKMRNDALMQMQERELVLREKESALGQRAAEFELGTAEEARAEQERITEFTARPILENVLRQTQEAEARGESPLIPSEKLKLAFLKSPKEQSQIAATAYQGLPKPQPVELREVGFTRDGQPMKGTAVFNPQSGRLELVPVVEQAWGDGTGGQSLDESQAGVNIVDFIKSKEGFYEKPYNDFKQTSIGYGTRAKPGETSITREEAEKRLAQEIDAARRNVIENVNKAGLDLDPQQIDALTSFNYNTGAIDKLLKGGKRTEEEIAAAMLLYTKAGGKTLPGLVRRRAEEAALFAGGASRPAIQPGATTAKQPTPQTPEQQRKAELEAKKLEGEIAAQEAAAKEKTQTVSRAVQKVERLKELSKKYIDPATGTPTETLKNATGLGEGVATFTRLNAPETRANQQELEREFLEKDLLEAAKDLKPVSEDEMKMLLARRPAITAAPEVWASYIQSIIKTMETGLPQGSVQPPAPADNAARLRALRGQ